MLCFALPRQDLPLVLSALLLGKKRLPGFHAIGACHSVAALGFV
jgi:hypothetical protein